MKIVGEVGMVLFIILFFFGVIFLAIFSGLLVDKDVAVRALETQGFSNVKITDRDWFLVSVKGGDKSDVVKFTAVATNPIGKAVEVTVFVGWPFKGATIRTK